MTRRRYDHAIHDADDPQGGYENNEIIEIRQVQELADFPADVQEAAAGFAEMQASSGQRSGS